MTRIAVLPGDGIGPEVMAEAVKSLPPGWDTVQVPAGAERYLATGELLTEEDLDAIRSSDALLFGAIGDPRIEDGVLERGILLRLRRELDLYVNLRPFPELDLVFVRENTEGLYSGGGSRDGDSATEVSVNTRAAIERCARYAFELAERRRKQRTLVHKSNVLVHAGGLWRDVVDLVARDHPQVSIAYEHADAAAYHLVRNRDRFDVILTENLFGDLLSDLAAGLGAGLGAAASANIHPEPSTRPTRCVGLFEPVHGSAPDIAGTSSADPSAAIGAAGMLVQTLQREQEAIPS